MLIFILASFKDEKLALPLVLFFLVVFSLELRARLSIK